MHWTFWEEMAMPWALALQPMKYKYKNQTSKNEYSVYNDFVKDIIKSTRVQRNAMIIIT